MELREKEEDVAYRRGLFEEDAAFWDKVAICETGCWEWRGATAENGYGRITRKGENKAAHRHAFELQIGPITRGHKVLHACDNPPCVRGSHLSVGTQADNMLDKQLKGRAGKALTAEQVIEIRQRYAAGGVSKRALAREFGVRQYSVQRILSNDHWSHL